MPNGSREQPMKFLLILRGMIGVLFGARLIAELPSWDAFFNLLADYLVVDGLFACLVAVFLVRDTMGTAKQRELVLAMTCMTDGIGRLASGAAIHLWPGIPGFPVTAVLFIGVMAVGTGIVGVAEAVVFTEEELAEHGKRHERPQFTAGPVSLAALFSIAFAVAAMMFMGNPDLMERLLSSYVLAASLAMFAMAQARPSRLTQPS
jgi:hypothetical protein